MYKGIIEEYRHYLPVSEKTPVITLFEGNTPLIPAPQIVKAAHLNGVKLYLKFEGLNPTGSFKDRGMTLAISKAVEEKSRAVICASTGNTSASAAAYAARAGIRCVVLIPDGAIALGKLSQAMIHGAKVIQVKGNFDDALELVKKIAEEYPITMVNSLNPYRIEGQKTGAFEIVDTLGESPAVHCIPVGNAGNITAYWKGYKEYFERKKMQQLPVLLGFQAEGSAPIVRGHKIEKPETIATAIRIGNPASWKQAEHARDQSGGAIDMVSDDQILDAYTLLASCGVFCEPASAASVAGFLKYAAKDYYKQMMEQKKKSLLNVVCVLTGHGLKDPERAIKSIEKPLVLDPDYKRIVKEIGI
jgi:threonine synthase